MKKYSFKIQSLLVTLLLCTLTACSADDELADNGGNATLNGTPIEVGAFPAFTENAATRAVGTFDAGKTAWANGDEILLKVEVFPGFDDVKNACTGTVASTECYKLTYDGTSWAADRDIALTTGTYEAGIKTTAYYAPCYEWNAASNALVLKTDKVAGTDEYLTAEKQMPYTSLTKEGKLSIAFNAARTYSRLRVVAVPNMEVTLSAAAFTPVGTTVVLGETTIKATADTQGNAYFYGTWAENANLKVALAEDGSYLTDVTKIVATASAVGNSYAIDGLANLTTYNQIGAGTAESPYRIYNATQLMNFDDMFKGESACTEHILLRNDIDLTGKTWEPICSLGTYGGVFNGGFHTIKGLEITSTVSYIGFFRKIKSDGILKNLIIKDCNIDANASYGFGTLVGYNDGKISNCHVLGGRMNNLGIGDTGGLAGNGNPAAEIIGCSVINTDMRVSAGGKLGGLVGGNQHITGCMFSGALVIDSSDRGNHNLAIGLFREANCTPTAIYCKNKDTSTQLLWNGFEQSAHDCYYVDGTTITWDTAITNMNTAIETAITEYHYVYDATLDCPKMVKK